MRPRTITRSYLPRLRKRTLRQLEGQGVGRRRRVQQWPSLAIVTTSIVIWIAAIWLALAALPKAPEKPIVVAMPQH